MLAARARYVGFADAIYLRHDMLHTICSHFARTCFAASRHCTSAQRTYRIAFTRYIVFIYRIAQQYIVRPAGRSSFNLTIFRKPNDKIRALMLPSRFTGRGRGIGPDLPKQNYRTSRKSMWPSLTQALAKHQLR